MAHSATLTKLTPSTATMAYNIDGLRMDHKTVSRAIDEVPCGRIVCVKSNKLSIDKYMNNPYVNVHKMLKDLGKRGRVPRENPDPESNELFFKSGVGFVVLRAGFEDASVKPKPYNVRICPQTGTVQIPGVQYPYETGRMELEYVLSILEDKLHLPHKLVIVNERIILMNFKFTIIGTASQYVILSALCNVLTGIRDGSDTTITPPFPITHVTDYYEANSQIYIKFSTPTDTNAERRTTVKIFTRRKINIMAATNPEVAQAIYEFLEALFRTYHSCIIATKVRYTNSRIDCSKVLEMF